MKDSILETTRQALQARKLQEQAGDPNGFALTWRENQKKVIEAGKRYKDPKEKTKVLVIQGSDRNKATCPGEEPKSLRLAEHAVKVLKRSGMQAHLLDLSRITSEKDRMIWPCKGCFSTSAALCHWPCVAEGQRVNSSMFTRIEKLREGEIISTGKVTRAWRTRDSATIYEVRVSDGRRVRLTANHRIKVHQPRARVKKDGYWTHWYPEQWKAVEDLSTGDLIPFQLGGDFGPPLIGVPENLYMLAGLVWGDGTTVGKPSCPSFNLYVPTKEKELIAKLQVLYPESKLKHRVADQMSYLTVPRIYSRTLIETLALDKSAPVEERSIPEPIMQGSETAARAFLRGWFTTDGCVETERNRVSLSSRSLPALRDAQLLLAKMGIKSCISYCDHLTQEIRGKELPRASSLSIRHWESIQTFKYKVGFIHPEKTQKLTSLKPPKRNFRVKEGKVTEVLRVGRAPVYDLEIAKSHEFVVEGVLVHNCTCYPDSSLNQTPDWMHDEIYSRLVESHGLMVICPVYWYSPPSVLKLMLDRMVCMDGANPDPRTTMNDAGTSSKDVKKAKALERGPRAGGESIWKYKRGKILAGRIYSLYVHGDADGADLVEASISKTLEWYGCIPAGPYAKESGYVGYYKPYADSHRDLDQAEEVWHAVERQAKAVAVAVKKAREAGMPVPAMPPDSEMK